MCADLVRVAGPKLYANGGGAETGSTRVVKASLRRSAFRRYRIIVINANDNHAFVAANDNSVVAGEAIAA